MTKPRTAREQANDLLVSLSGRDDAVAIVEAFIKLTRADKRERCAVIAETHSATDCDGPDCGVEIAKAVRRGEEGS